jgi:thiosulfate dehydrogenase [quinone] large subunit
MKRLPAPATYATWLALARVVTGIIWLAHGVPKFLHPEAFMPPNGFVAAYIARGVATTSGSYHTFLLQTVQPNLQLFAQLVRFGEVLVGLSLVLGALTRIGGLFGVLLPLNYLLARGNLTWSQSLQSPELVLAVLSAISLVLPTGRFLGFDGLFAYARRRPKTVRAEFVPEPPLDKPTAPP